MTPLIICAIIAAIFTLYLIAPIALSHKRRCYILMIFIPCASLGIYMNIGSPALSSKPALFSQNNDERDTLNDLRKEEAFLLEKMKRQRDDVTTIIQLAGLYMAQEKLDAAIDLLSNARETHQDNEDLALQLGTAYFAKGLLHAEHKEKAQALALLQKAYEISPENAPYLSDLRHFIGKIEMMGAEIDAENKQ